MRIYGSFLRGMGPLDNGQDNIQNNNEHCHKSGINGKGILIIKMPSNHTVNLRDVAGSLKAGTTIVEKKINKQTELSKRSLGEGQNCKS